MSEGFCQAFCKSAFDWKWDRHSDCPETSLSKESGGTIHLWICPRSHSNADGKNGKWPRAHCTLSGHQRGLPHQTGGPGQDLENKMVHVAQEWAEILQRPDVTRTNSDPRLNRMFSCTIWLFTGKSKLFLLSVSIQDILSLCKDRSRSWRVDQDITLETVSNQKAARPRGRHNPISVVHL